MNQTVIRESQGCTENRTMGILYYGAAVVQCVMVPIGTFDTLSVFFIIFVWIFLEERREELPVVRWHSSVSKCVPYEGQTMSGGQQGWHVSERDVIDQQFVILLAEPHVKKSVQQCKLAGAKGHIHRSKWRAADIVNWFPVSSWLTGEQSRPTALSAAGGETVQSFGFNQLDSHRTWLSLELRVSPLTADST